MRAGTLHLKFYHLCACVHIMNIEFREQHCVMPFLLPPPCHAGDQTWVFKLGLFDDKGLHLLHALLRSRQPSLVYFKQCLLNIFVVKLCHFHNGIDIINCRTVRLIEQKSQMACGFMGSV